MVKKNKIKYTYAVGKRKTSSARIRLFKGKGENMVNNLPFSKYFPGKIELLKFQQPFKTADVLDKYYVTVKVIGGGKNSQIDAVSLGISRALSLLDREKFRPSLKKQGLLTRDSRTRERRKVNTGGKARRKRQSPKR